MKTIWNKKKINIILRRNFISKYIAFFILKLFIYQQLIDFSFEIFKSSATIFDISDMLIPSLISLSATSNISFLEKLILCSSINGSTINVISP